MYHLKYWNYCVVFELFVMSVFDKFAHIILSYFIELLHWHYGDHSSPPPQDHSNALSNDDKQQQNNKVH